VIITPKRKAKLFKLFKARQLPYLPFILGIETGNICNLQCPLCPTGLDDPAMKKGFMNIGLFKVIFDQLKNSLISINLYSWGEPLLNPDLIAMIEYAKKVNEKIHIITSTNLNIKNNQLLSDLVKSGIDEIIVSCDGACQDTYSKYRVGGDFNLVINNMKYLVLEAKKYNSRASVIWNFLVFKHNEHEIGEAKKIADSLGVKLRIGKMRTSMKNEILKPHSESIKKDKEWIPDNPEFSVYDKDGLSTKIIIKSCRKPWQEISINWDGKIFPCCAVYGDAYNFGNIEGNAIKHSWNNNMYIQARSEILDKKKVAKTICGICRNNGFMHM
jgi:radical SAM protein with 4Fe4S-binding SPASM domain